MDLYGWIVYPKYVASHNDNAFDWLKQEASVHAIELDVVFSEDIVIVYDSANNFVRHNGLEVTKLPDFVLIRTYDSVISRFFERVGIPVINSTIAMELAKNKMLTHEVLSTYNIPTPLTAYVDGGKYDYCEMTNLFDSNCFVVKRIDGAKGENVFLVENEQEMTMAIDSCNGRCICQQFIAESKGRDVRVWVVGDKVVGAVLRYSETSFLSNYSQGGKVRAFELSSEAITLALDGCRALGIEFAGVDLLFTDNGFIINEINGNAGFRTLSHVGENAIPNELFKYIKTTYNKNS